MGPGATVQFHLPQKNLRRSGMRSRFPDAAERFHRAENDVSRSCSAHEFGVGDPVGRHDRTYARKSER
jgi:hypothetical protein